MRVSPRHQLPLPDEAPLCPARGIVNGILLSFVLWALLCLGVFVVLAHAAPQPACTGLVTEVHDGDTLTVHCACGPLRVRLAGIDAPELTQPYGLAAKSRATALVLGRTVTIGAGSLDRYGRRVAVVTLADGRSLGLTLVQEGWAMHYVAYAKRATDLRDAEQAARTMGLGLWQDPGAIAPWDWRKGVRP